MSIIEKMEKLAGTIKLIEEFINKTQTIKSPKLQRVFKGIQSMEKAHSAMKQAQQVQELLQMGNNHKLFGQMSGDNVLPLLLLLLNNLAIPETPEEETPANT